MGVRKSNYRFGLAIVIGYTVKYTAEMGRSELTCKTKQSQIYIHRPDFYIDLYCVFPFLRDERDPIYITKTRLFNILKISPPKTGCFQIKILIFFFFFFFFHISARNIDCEYSLEPRL